MKPADQSCANCAFWQSVAGKTGDCVRYPPAAFLTVGHGTGNVSEQVTAFPKVSAFSWCGEWKKA